MVVVMVVVVSDVMWGVGVAADVLRASQRVEEVCMHIYEMCRVVIVRVDACSHSMDCTSAILRALVLVFRSCLPNRLQTSTFSFSFHVSLF